MGKLLRKFNRESGAGSMHKQDLASLRESELEQEMQNVELVDDDEDRPLEDADGSEDLSD